MSARIDVRPELLRWACERSGGGIDALKGKFPKLPKWIAGEVKPTFKQIERFAEATHTPMGYLFLPDPPEERLPIPDFRTVSDSTPDRPSPDLLDTIYAMQHRQGWLHETLVEDGMEPLSFAGSARLSDKPESIAADMRRVTGIEDGWAGKVSTWQQAVGELRRRIEKLGIIAVINGVVGNNPRRKLDVLEFRGFAISDPYAPLIFVNGADAKSAQMFTLAHELAHIWVGKGGLSGFDGLFPQGKGVEDWCNRAAAEFLVPAQALKGRWKEIGHTERPFEALAREFKVSPIVAARRALDLELIKPREFFSFYEEYTKKEKKRETSGGNFYRNQNFRVGELFAGRVIRAALEGRIGFKEAYGLTGLHGGTFQNYASRLGFDL